MNGIEPLSSHTFGLHWMYTQERGWLSEQPLNRFNLILLAIENDPIPVSSA